MTTPSPVSGGFPWEPNAVTDGPDGPGGDAVEVPWPAPRPPRGVQRRRHLRLIDPRYLTDAELLRELEQIQAQDERRRYVWEDQARPAQLEPAPGYRVWFLLAGRGYGKALDLDTPLPTPTGWTTMGKVQTDDMLIGSDGRPTRVVKAHDVLLDRECVKVTFSDQSEIVCDREHLWATRNRKERRTGSPAAVRTAAEIAATVAHGARRDRNHSVQITAPLAGQPTDLPVDPYVLGYWLGDGTSATAEVTVSDQDAGEILPELALRGAPVSGPVRRRPGARCATYPIGAAPKRRGSDGRMLPNGSLHSNLRELGVLRNKHIPPQYLRATEAQRRDLLAGLMDSDGSAIKDVNYAEFCVTSGTLAGGVHELVVSLGLVCRMAESDSVLNGRVVGRRWRLKFRPDRHVFKLARKNARHALAGQASRHTHRMIVSVEPVESRPVRCVTVDAPDALYLCGESMIPTHNTRVGSETVRKWATARRGLYAVVAKSHREVKAICFEAARAGLLACIPPDDVEQYKRSPVMLTLKNGSVIQAFSSEDPDVFRGYAFDGVWLDEFSSFRKTTAQAVYDMMWFCLREAPDPRVIITSTPKALPHVKALVKRAETDNTVVITSGHTRENAANLSEAALAELEARYEGTRLGRQELSGELLEDVEGALWTPGMFEVEGFRLRLADVEGMLSKRVLAVDPAVTSSETSDGYGIAVAGVGIVDKRRHVYGLHTDEWRATPQAAMVRIRDTFYSWDCDYVILETNNGGDYIPALLSTVDDSIPTQKIHARKGKLLRAEPVSQLYEQGRAHHIGSPARWAPLESIMTTFTGDPGEDSPDRLDAWVYAALALAGPTVRDSSVANAAAHSKSAGAGANHGLAGVQIRRSAPAHG